MSGSWHWARWILAQSSSIISEAAPTDGILLNLGGKFSRRIVFTNVVFRFLDGLGASDPIVLLDGLQNSRRFAKLMYVLDIPWTGKAPVCKIVPLFQDLWSDYESGGQEFESLRARQLRIKPRTRPSPGWRPATTAAKVALSPMILTLSWSTSICEMTDWR
jgi:hypothetical protein